MKYSSALLLCLLVFLGSPVMAQTLDSANVPRDSAAFIQTQDTVRKDTASKIRHSPRKAAIRSALIPGWGQAYNKKYWKIPVVYTALGIPTYLFIDNLKWYRRTNYAYQVVISGTTNPDSLNAVHPDLKPFVDRKNSTSLVNYRNEFRRNMDYSVLFFLVFWGLNVVDATVDAHLKEFDVGPDLSLKLKPGYSPTGNTYGVSLVLAIK